MPDEEEVIEGVLLPAQEGPDRFYFPDDPPKIQKRKLGEFLFDRALSGWTIRRSAQFMGIGEARARKLLDAYCRRRTELRRSSRMRIAIERQDRYLAYLDEGVRAGDIAYIMAAEKTNIDQAKLMGLEAPRQLEISSEDAALPSELMAILNSAKEKALTSPKIPDDE